MFEDATSKGVMNHALDGSSEALDQDASCIPTLHISETQGVIKTTAHEQSAIWAEAPLAYLRLNTSLRKP